MSWIFIFCKDSGKNKPGFSLPYFIYVSPVNLYILAATKPFDFQILFAIFALSGPMMILSIFNNERAASNAEESACAAEKLNAQAEQMNLYIDHSVDVCCGRQEAQRSRTQRNPSRKGLQEADCLAAFPGEVRIGMGSL